MGGGGDANPNLITFDISEVLASNLPSQSVRTMSMLSRNDSTLLSSNSLHRANGLQHAMIMTLAVAEL